MKDPRYKVVKILLKTGHIKTFSEIYKYIPKTVIRNVIGTSGTRMDALVEDPGGYRVNELFKIAGLIGYDPFKFALMALEEGRKKG